MLEFLTTPPKVFTYPGGEPTVQFPNGLSDEPQIALLTGANSHELLTLVMWGSSVFRSGRESVALIPYLPGARADHEKEPVGFDALVYASLINSGRFDHVIAVDPHSPVMPEQLHWSDVEVVTAAEIFRKYLRSFENGRPDIAGVIIPDEGAIDRASEVAEVLKVPTYQAHKHRDYRTGKLTGFSVDPLPDGEMLVVDDICDGGGTFMGLSSVCPDNPLHLWVTHGIFSGDADLLFAHYSSITTTNSHPGSDRFLGHPRYHRIDITPSMLNKFKETQHDS